MAITLDTDWGAKGAQLTGAQVQNFIKQQFRELIYKGDSLNTKINDLSQKFTEQDSLIEAITDGCLIAYHRKSDNWPVAIPYWQWPEIEASGEIADGVLVLVDGQAPILVAPTDKQLCWAKYNIALNLKVGTDYELAYSDFTGQTRTAALMSKRTVLFGSDTTESEDYAPVWCYEYDRSYLYRDFQADKIVTIGVQKNKWWLPSIAELVVIWKHKYAINKCLSVIKDSTPIYDTWYWSSTEATSSTVWRLHMGTGTIQGNNNKTSYLHQARAITAFYNPLIFNGESDSVNEPTLADNRFERFGDCVVFTADENAEPIAIKYPLTEEKIQAAIINHKYTDTQISTITTNYQLSLSDGFEDETAKKIYAEQYAALQSCQVEALIISNGALAK